MGEFVLAFFFDTMNFGEELEISDAREYSVMFEFSERPVETSTGSLEESSRQTFGPYFFIKMDYKRLIKLWIHRKQRKNHDAKFNMLFSTS